MMGFCQKVQRTSLVIFLICLVSSCARNQYTLKNNGYEGLLVAIHEDVNENDQLITRIQDIFTEGSSALFRATRNRVFFHNITILIPFTWKKKTEYKKAKQQSFDTANILIDKGETDTPYVWSSAGCGIAGFYMHLTPNYILDKDRSLRIWGPYGKTIVHEFGHLRWGVKDEYAYRELGEPSFYKSYGRIHPVGCTSNIKGRLLNYKTRKECSENKNTGLPEDDCYFSADITQDISSASIMFRQFLTGIEDFCDSDPSNSATFHNSEAPNRHNKMCRGKSVWDVMRRHVDFTGDQIVRQDVLDTTPIFHIVQKPEEKKRICLVLDVSGSMSGEPLKKMRQATSSFILGSLELNSKLAIVSFNSRGTTLQGLAEVTSQNDRDMLITKLPSSVGGSTSIGAGIQRATEILKADTSDEQDVAGSQIILLTDGQENASPFMKDVEPEVKRLGITIHSIAYGQYADGKITALSASTGGRSLYASTNQKSTGIQDALNSLATGGASQAKKAKVTVSSETLTFNSGGEESSSFYIDGTVGNETFVSFSYSNYIEVRLTTPDDTVYNSSSQFYKDQLDFNLVTIQIPGVAKSGKFIFVVKSSTAQDVVVGVTSRSSDSTSEPIRVVSYLEVDSVSFTNGTVLEVYADVLQGYQPVIGAMVEADVERPDEVSKIVRLDDNGAGCDMLPKDGRYCGYFMAQDFKGNGRYGVKIKVKTNDGESAQVISHLGLNAPPILSDDTVADLYNDEPTVRSVAAFQRVDAAGEITVTGFPADPNYVVPDTIPPARITDLKVYLINSTITLKWAAPGDDMTRGRAAKYEVRMTQNYTLLNSGYFATDQLITQSKLLSGNLSRPLQSSQLEKFVYEIPSLDKNASYYMSVRASDESGNVGELSNIVVTSYAPPLLPTVESSKDPPIYVDNTVVIAVCVTSAVVLIAIMVVAVVVYKCRPPRTTNPVEDQHREAHIQIT